MLFSANVLQQPRKSVVLFAFLAIAVLTIFLRLNAFEEPLYGDLCVYAYVGNQMLAGEKLYADLFDNKPPGIYIIYMLAIMIAGYNEATIFWLGMVATLASLGLIFVILLELAGPNIALLGTLIWALTSNSVHLMTTQPNTEAFINVFLQMVFWFIIKALRSSHGYLWFSGLAFAVASFCKTNVLFIFLVVIAYLFLTLRRPLYTNSNIITLKEITKLIIPAACFWVLVFAYFYYTGRWNGFYDIVFRALKNYAGNIFVNEWHFFTQPQVHFQAFKHELIILSALTMLWLVLKSTGNKTLWDGLILSYLVGGLLMIGSLSNPIVLYYQVLLPPLVLLSALSFHEVVNRFKKNDGVQYLIMGIAVLSGLGCFIYYTVHYLLLSPVQISKIKYGTGQVWKRMLGKYLGSITKPEDTIYQWGNCANLYFYSQRKM